jgi:ferritin-like metal-binding protein YciE
MDTNGRLSMFEKLNTPEEIFSFKLGSALSMENTILEMLDDLQEKTNRGEIRQMLAAHAEDTRHHIANIRKSFELLGEEIDDSPCPAMQGIEKEGKATLKMTDDSIADAAILAGAIETEHYEIAVYEILVTNAKARGATEVAALLQENLDSEHKTLDAVKETAGRIATTEGWAVAPAAA